MGTHEMGIALTVAGGAAEIIGLALAVLGVKEDRDRARAVVAVERPVETRPVGRSLGLPFEVEGTEPERSPLEERVATLERAVREAQLTEERRFRELEEQVQDEVNRVFFGARERVIEADERLRRFLADLVGGGVGKRLVGAPRWNSRVPRRLPRLVGGASAGQAG